MKHPTERINLSNMPTRRRSETPLQPSKLENIESIRRQLIHKKNASVQQIKFSKSIIVDDYGL
jgi:hypothetical protein